MTTTNIGNLFMALLIALSLGLVGCGSSASAQTAPTTGTASIAPSSGTPVGSGPGTMVPTATPPAPVLNPARIAALVAAANARAALYTNHVAEVANMNAADAAELVRRQKADLEASTARGQEYSSYYQTRAIVDTAWGIVWTSAPRDNVSTSSEVEYKWVGGTVTVKAVALNATDVRFPLPTNLPADTDINVTLVGCTTGLPPSLPSDGNVWIGSDTAGRWLGFHTAK